MSMEGGTGSEEGVGKQYLPSLPPCCPSRSPSAQSWTHPGQSQLFADLSQEELSTLRRFLTQNLGPGLVDAAQARPLDNCLFSVELQLPPKAAALAHLDRGNTPPAREALAIVFFGRQPQPNVTELVVGPLPQPSYMRDVTMEHQWEFLDIDQMIFDRELPQAAGGGNLVILTTAPRIMQSGDKATWIYLHPIGLELLVDHKALDPAQWTIQKVQWHRWVLVPKSQLSPGPTPPLQFHPQGPHFSVQGSRVASSLWTFSLVLGAFSGPRIFDLRFQGERLAYEISLHEALLVYGGNTPVGMLATPLTRSVDCPYLGTYVDWHFLLESQAPRTLHDAFCVFEQNKGLPLRRHHSDVFSHYFGGLVETVLVFRSVSALLNYDYVWDVIFHSNGAITAKLHATGFINSVFHFGAARRYGNQVRENTLGTVHTHSAHYKVDLDVGDSSSNALENWVWAELMAFIYMAVTWSPKHQTQRLQVIEKQLEMEEQAAFPLGGASPHHLYQGSECLRVDSVCVSVRGCSLTALMWKRDYGCWVLSYIDMNQPWTMLPESGASQLPAPQPAGFLSQRRGMVSREAGVMVTPFQKTLWFIKIHIFISYRCIF
ncbi:hypothetical protein FD755_023658 [Muntiacus reevesi]|uniref:Amine oxidase n=1 Tax=Muntiacus reevesi TaxID=9886 RepID=A0A5N3VWR0_MUNRE|nr:hypothetical protein FD755_023658 [Muntiacus reevesi]